MTKFVGRRGVLLLAKESSRGTATTTNGLWFPRSTVSFDDKIESARQDEALGVIADSDSLFVTQKMAEGDVEFDLTDKEIGIILTSLLGSSPNITGGPTYAHAYTLNNSNQHQSLTVLYQDPNITKAYSLGVVDSLKITVEQNGIVKGAVSFKSRVGKDWTTQTANFTGMGQKFLHQHLVFKLASNIAGLSAATAISLKKLELNIKANTDFDTVIGTVEPEDVLGHEFTVEGTLELNKEDETYRNYMLANTYRSADISFIRASNSSFQIQLPRVDFTEWEQDRKLNDIASQKINFKANYDAANALDIISTCLLTNTYAGTGY